MKYGACLGQAHCSVENTNDKKLFWPSQNISQDVGSECTWKKIGTFINSVNSEV